MRPVVVVTLLPVVFVQAGLAVELYRLRHSAAESSFFNFTLIKINAKSPGRGSGVSGASLVSLLGALGGFLMSSEASFGCSLELFTAHLGYRRRKRPAL